MEKVMNFNFIISLLMLSSVVLTQVSINSTPKNEWWL